MLVLIGGLHRVMDASAAEAARRQAPAAALPAADYLLFDIHSRITVGAITCGPAITISTYGAA